MTGGYMVQNKSVKKKGFDLLYRPDTGLSNWRNIQSADEGLGI